MKELSIRKGKLLVILLAVLFIVCAAGMCLILGIRVQKVTCNDLFILSFLQEDKNFHGSDIVIAENEDIDLTYVKNLYPRVANGFRTESAEVLATNDNYSYFTGMEIRAGTFFNHVQTEKELLVAVLNETAAYQLFGNYDCIGESVYLDQNAFEVIGIVKEHGNETTAKIYIPDKTAAALHMSCSEVNQLWCRFTNVAEAAFVIKKMGYSMEEMDILQMDLFKIVFMQRFFVLLILAGAFLFFRTCKILFHGVRRLRQKETIDRNKIAEWILQILTCMGSLLFTVKIMQLSWCVPPNYKLIGKSWKDSFYAILKFYSLSGIELNHMQFLSRWNLESLFCFFICIIISLLLVIGLQDSK